jgi:hypothetical protein
MQGDASIRFNIFGTSFDKTKQLHPLYSRGGGGGGGDLSYAPDYI